ncbi:MAG: hypothetical protein ACJ762_00700 [Solirubrobacteraceae bacterium]
MESSFEDRRDEDRRHNYGALLLATFASARRPLSFQDLVSIVAPQGARLSDVADWLATARQSGMISDKGFEEGPDGEMVGPRLFALADTARAVIRVDRRHRDRRAGAC